MNSQQLQERLTQNLKRNLSAFGSMEYSLTWKAHLTPALRRICRLRASAHPIGDSVCFGWPTPDANAMNLGEGLETWDARMKVLKAKHKNVNGAGMPLAIAAQLAGWPTPTLDDANNVTRESG